MFRKLFFVGLLFAAVALAGSLWLAIDYQAHLPQHLSQHETIVLGQNRFTPGTQAALRVVVRDSRDANPLSDAAIRLSLQSPNGSVVPIFTGTTDAYGTADVSFHVPDEAEGNQTLVVETTSALGSDHLEQPVKLERDYRLLLTTDKPLYQPGQVIHLRVLALSTFDRKPAIAQKVEVTIADGKGNKVFRANLMTSDYGVASTDFQLASEVNTGLYKITTVTGNTSSEKTVTVEHYTLPKFDVQLTTERTFYQPGDHVRGSISANYFFGKTVADAQVMIEGYTFDVERTVTFQLQGVTDARGNFNFEFDLPAHLTGSDLDNGLGRYTLQATVIDQAQHAEASNLSLPVAANPIVIQAIPESGQLRLGVENILYVLTSTPDGASIETALSLTLPDLNQTASAHTDRYGLAEVRITPTGSQQHISVQATAANGAAASREFNFTNDLSSTILLRPDRPVYRVGDTMTLTLLSSAGGTIYLDIVREGQTISTRAVPIANGRAEVAIDLTPDLYGTLELHAYRLLSTGTIVRDTRLVIVDAANDLDVTLRPDHDVYRPGDRVGLNINVTDHSGAGAQSAIGLAIVDESVFALAEQDPGFAKLYFLLERQLLEPKYDLHGFSLSHLLNDQPATDQVLRSAQENAANASLAEAAPQQVNFSLAANSHADTVRRAAELQSKFFSDLSNGLYGIAFMLSIPVILLTFYALNQRQRAGSSFMLALIAAAFSCAVLLSSRSDPIGLAVLAGLGLIVLIVSIWHRRDHVAKWAIVSMLAYLIVALLLGYASSQPVRIQVGYDIRMLGWLSLALVGLAYGMLLADLTTSSCATLSLSTLLMLILIVAVGCAPAAPAMLMSAPMATQASPEKISNTPADTSNAAQPPRLRQYFPETMLWLPDGVTDPNGHLRLDFTAADNITTWRMTALASTRDGRLGSVTNGLRVFQDFFIDLDLPAALTVGDEVSVPVGVFNYLPETQTVRLEVAPADWFELLDEPTKEMTIGANDISVVYFRIRARAFGDLPFKVTAWGSQLSDAIQKMVHVTPNGKPLSFTQSDRLAANSIVTRTISIPSQAIAGTSSLVVKIYPGVLSQVVEGLDSILRLPNGCFEQTSSTTYPNVLVLDYLQAVNQVSPEVQLKAEQYINLGYQRLTTFEVDGGAFSLFGNPPPDRMLTAYGLQEFGDMSRVHPVDPDLVKRAAEWLMAQQNADGSWNNDRGLVHESTWSNLKNDRLPVTAYIVWSLFDAGFGQDQRAQKGLSYVRQMQADATDPYVIALVANALVAVDRAASANDTPINLDPTTQTVLDRLAEMAVKDKDTATWSSGVATFMGGKGQTGSIETTAMAALAFLRANNHPQLANAALTTLIQQKDGSGTWYTTQATVLALKALIQSVRAGSEQVNASVTVKVDGGQTRNVQITPDNLDVTQLLAFNDLSSGTDHTIEISAVGDGNLMYQIAGTYYLPWSAAPQSTDSPPPVSIKVAYDRAKLNVNDTVAVSVTVSLNQAGAHADSALIDLGVPPGFVIQAEDLAALIAHDKDKSKDFTGPTMQRYELTGRQVLVYLNNLSNGQPYRFSYRLTAKFPLVAQTPPSAAYDYYNPDIIGEAVPQTLTVAP
jgi:uncharacterized protein YfaS (alpha-2-macroglobulin family)